MYCQEKQISHGTSAVKLYLSENYSCTEVARKFCAIISTLKKWFSSYKNDGIDGLKKHIHRENIHQNLNM